MNAIYVLWLRQLKRYMRSKSRIVGSLGQPLLFFAILGFGLNSIFEKAGGGSYTNFLAPGIIAQTIMFTAMFSGIELIWDRQFGFLKETLVAPVSRLEIVIGRTIGGATVATIQGVIVLIVTLLMGFKPYDIIQLPLAFGVMFLIALLFSSLGTLIGSMLQDFQGFQLIMNFIVMPIFFLSGALFPLNGAPDVLKTVASFNPLTYGVDALRSTLVNTSQFNLVFDVGVIALLTAVTLLIGNRTFSKMQA